MVPEHLRFHQRSQQCRQRRGDVSHGRGSRRCRAEGSGSGIVFGWQRHLPVHRFPLSHGWRARFSRLHHAWRGARASSEQVQRAHGGAWRCRRVGAWFACRRIFRFDRRNYGFRGSRCGHDHRRACWRGTGQSLRAGAQDASECLRAHDGSGLHDGYPNLH